MKKSFVYLFGAAITSMAITGAANAAIPLPGDRLFPESLSISDDGVAYIGSMTGGILRVSLKDGESNTFVRSGDSGTGTIFGVMVDKRNHTLWACTNDFSAAGVKVQGERLGDSRLVGFDLGTGALQHSFSLPGPQPICNDIAVSPDGDVYVTDSAAPHLLRWSPGDQELKVFISDPRFDAKQGGGLDGIAFGSDGNLYVNNFYSGEIFRVSMNRAGQAGTVQKLALSRPLEKPDGMRPLGGMSFLLTEGGGRVDQVLIEGGRAEISTLRSEITEPTGVEKFGHSLWYVQGYSTWLLHPGPQVKPPTLPFTLQQEELPH